MNRFKRRFGTKEVYLSKFGKSGRILVAGWGGWCPDYRVPVDGILEPPLGSAAQLFKIYVSKQ
jgi:hypothetical protein